MGQSDKATEDNIMRRICFECWVNKAADTHSKYILLIALPLQQCCTNAPQCYVKRILMSRLSFNSPSFCPHAVILVPATKKISLIF